MAWVPKGGTSRRFLNTETGQTVSRRQYDKLHNPASSAYGIGYERAVKASSTTVSYTKTKHRIVTAKTRAELERDVQLRRGKSYAVMVYLKGKDGRTYTTDAHILESKNATRDILADAEKVRTRKKDSPKKKGREYVDEELELDDEGEAEELARERKPIDVEEYQIHFISK